MEIGQILGIVFGSIALAVMIGLIFWHADKRKKMKQQSDKVDRLVASGKSEEEALEEVKEAVKTLDNIFEDDEFESKMQKEKIKKLAYFIKEQKNNITWEIINKIDEVAKPYAHDLQRARVQQINLDYIMKVRDGWYDQAPLDVLEVDGYLLNEAGIRITNSKFMVDGKEVEFKNLRKVSGLGANVLEFITNEEKFSIAFDDDLVMQSTYILVNRLKDNALEQQGKSGRKRGLR